MYNRDHTRIACDKCGVSVPIEDYKGAVGLELMTNGNEIDHPGDIVVVFGFRDHVRKMTHHVCGTCLSERIFADG